MPFSGAREQCQSVSLGRGEDRLYFAVDYRFEVGFWGLWEAYGAI